MGRAAIGGPQTKAEGGGFRRWKGTKAEEGPWGGSGWLWRESHAEGGGWT